LRALVVDDSKAIRTLLSRMLSDLGFDTAQAADGLEAMAQLRAGLPDVALVDWNMPNMNGMQLVVAIRHKPAYAGIKLMMVTTESESSQMMRALEAGADEYVTKPFTRDVIEDKLRILGLPLEQHA
jgi:two-component system chemotaxis response regulator CheY